MMGGEESPRSRRALAGVLALAAALGGCAGAQAARTTSGWFDAPLTGWNRAGAPVPLAPAPQGNPPGLGRCGESVRAPTTEEDRAVAAAGWTLFGPEPAREAIVVVQGMTSVDGMCRPLGFQAFVFANGRFAGTLSPVPMNSRTDGAQTRVELTSPPGIAADFARYAEGDPLCCPSRVSHVTYRLEGGADGGQPVVVPLRVVTQPTR
jgi:LppP/LprE lipoprotein